MKNMPRCPRCDSEDVVRGGPHHTEFQCRGRCLQENRGENEWEWTYFQYDKEDNVFCWPAVGVMYKCRSEDVEAVRQGKLKPDFV